MEEGKFQIALETGIDGGSISIFKNGEILDFWCNDKSGSKSDYLIEGLKKILEDNDLLRENIEHLAYSVYPGSHTGLKIGASLSKGLGLALGVEVYSKNLFDCIYSFFQTDLRNVLIMLPVGKVDFIWRYYEKKSAVYKSGKIKIGENIKENIGLFDNIESLLLIPFKSTGKIVQLLEAEITCENLHISDLGTNLSEYIGICGNNSENRN